MLVQLSFYKKFILQEMYRNVKEALEWLDNNLLLIFPKSLLIKSSLTLFDQHLWPKTPKLSILKT